MLEQYILLSFIVAGVCSLWMYSSLLCGLNKKFFDLFYNLSEKFKFTYSFKTFNKQKKYKFLQLLFYKISKLSTCSFCFSFWVSNVTQWMYLFYENWYLYFLNSLGIAFLSWLWISCLKKLNDGEI